MMYFLATSRFLLLFVAVLGAVDASALTLGRLRGAAVLGQPLQVAVPVQFGVDEDSTASCFLAEVFYGDVRQEGQGVSIKVENADEGKAALVRVRSANRVDEPVVTVTLRAGCEQRTSRRYVLLADLPTETAPSVTGAGVPEVMPANTARESAAAAAPVTAATLSIPSPAPSASTNQGAKPPLPVASDVKTERRKKSVKKSDADPASSTPERAVAPLVRELKSRSRLKLAPWELGPEKDPILKSSDNLLFLEPLENLQKRAEAVAAWRALNTTAEEVLRQDARAQAVEVDLKTLKELTVRNQRSLAEITGRLQQAEAERYANPLVYVLVVLLLVLVTVAVLLWSRLRDLGGNTSPWWRGDTGQPGGPPSDAGDENRISQFETIAPASLPPPPSAALNEGVPAAQTTAPADVDLLLGDSVFGGLNASGAKSLTSHETVPAAVQAVPPLAQALPASRTPEVKDFGVSVSGALRAINTREMLDVRQQAEFFMTLGQYEEAITALTESINTSESANPLVYLDLLKIFHTLSRKAEFDRYREEFNQEFAGRVPVYVGFNRGGMPLEAYPEIIERIEALWPAEECVNYIESCLVRKPADPPDTGIDLEAFRDLLMLHGIAQRLESLSESAMVPFSALRQTTASQDGTALATMPVQVQSDLGLSSVDLELDLAAAPGNNLIDFDVSGFSKLGDLPKAP